MYVFDEIDCWPTKLQANLTCVVDVLYLIIVDGEHNHSMGSPMDGTPPQSEDR